MRFRKNYFLSSFRFTKLYSIFLLTTRHFILSVESYANIKYWSLLNCALSFSLFQSMSHRSRLTNTDREHGSFESPLNTQVGFTSLHCRARACLAPACMRVRALTGKRIILSLFVKTIWLSLMFKRLFRLIHNPILTDTIKIDCLILACTPM